MGHLHFSHTRPEEGAALSQQGKKKTESKVWYGLVYL